MQSALLPKPHARVIPIKPGAVSSRPAGKKFEVKCASCNVREMCLPEGLNSQDMESFEDAVYTRRRVKRGEFRLAAKQVRIGRRKLGSRDFIGTEWRIARSLRRFHAANDVRDFLRDFGEISVDLIFTSTGERPAVFGTRLHSLQPPDLLPRAWFGDDRKDF